jgi:hypothetical protein
LKLQTRSQILFLREKSNITENKRNLGNGNSGGMLQKVFGEFG